MVYTSNILCILAKADNEEFVAILKKYHREKVCSNKKISARLSAEHGIEMRLV